MNFSKKSGRHIYSNLYADLVLLNGKIWTADPSNPSAEAVAIRNEKIIAVGKNSDIKKYIAPHTKIVDLGDRRVLPGFEDSHTHLLRTAARFTGPIRNLVPKKLKPKWIRIIGRAGRILFRQIYHRVHKLLGITPMDYNWLPILPKFLIKKSYKRMMDELLKMGITSVTEAGLIDWRELETLQELYDVGALKVRFNILVASRLLDSAIKRGYRTGFGNEWIRITGVKLYADGWLVPRTAAVRKKYEHLPSKGVLFYRPDEAIRVVEKAHRAGLRVATHAIGDRAIEVMLHAYENILINENGEQEEDHRYTIEHAQVMAKDLVDKMKNLEVIASIQLSFATSDCGADYRALGEERYEYCYAWKKLLNAGIQCVGGSDYPIEVVSPMWGIQRIVTMREIDGTPPEGCHADQALSIEEALKLITIKAAYNSFEENIKGSLEVGKLADLIVLEKEIFETNPREIYKIKVEMTIVGGKIMYISPDSTLYPII